MNATVVFRCQARLFAFRVVNTPRAEKGVNGGNVSPDEAKEKNVLIGVIIMLAFQFVSTNNYTTVDRINYDVSCRFPELARKT